MARAGDHRTAGLLLLDEPLSALDEHLWIRMRAELRRMQQELGITFIHVTHTQLEAIALADVVVVMDRGQIRQAGPAREIYAAPATATSPSSSAARTSSRAASTWSTARRARISGPEFSNVLVPSATAASLETGQPLDIAVRRDDIELVPASDPVMPPDTTAVPGPSAASKYQGNFVKVMMDAAGEEEFVAYVPERRFFDDSLKVGDRVMAVWQIERTQLLALTGAERHADRIRPQRQARHGRRSAVDAPGRPDPRDTCFDGDPCRLRHQPVRRLRGPCRRTVGQELHHARRQRRRRLGPDVEGLSANGALHPMQQAFRENHGLQCGFCTPGMLMSSVDLVAKNPDPSEAEGREWLEGNICRCTGYQNIVKSVIAGAAALRNAS